MIGIRGVTFYQAKATELASFVAVFAIMSLGFRLILVGSRSLRGMMTHLNSASWDSDGNRLVPLHGIQVALGLAFLAAGAFLLFTVLGDRQWHQHHPGAGASGFPDPLWMSILWIGLPLAPFVLSVLLLANRSEESKAGGAGVAAGLFACGLIFAIAALALPFFSFFPDPYALPEEIAALTFVACSVWIIVSAFRIGKVSWGVFFLAFGATLIFMTWGNKSLENAEHKLDRQNEQPKAQAAIITIEPVVVAAPLTLNAEVIGTAYGFQVSKIKENGKRLHARNAS